MKFISDKNVFLEYFFTKNRNGPGYHLILHLLITFPIIINVKLFYRLYHQKTFSLAFIFLEIVAHFKKFYKIL